MIRPRLIVLLLWAGCVVHAQPSTIPAEARQAAGRITAAALARDLDFLASDALAGRNTPSPGFDKAAERIAARLKAAGLEPAGDSGTFLQHYTMREQAADTAAAAIQIGGTRFTFGDDFVMRSFAGPVSGSLPVVYVGHGWTVPAKNIDSFSGVDVKGKIVLAHGPRALPKGTEIKAIGRINIGATPVFAEAERRGAAAVLVIPDESTRKGWAQARNQGTTQGELVPAVPSAYAAVAITSVLIAPRVVEALLAGEQIDGATLVKRGEAQDYPESFQLKKSVTVVLAVAATTDHRPYNVVAILRGSDPQLRNEYLVLESHLDGAVGGRAVDGDGIYNAADDNATGSAGNLAIAEALAAGPRPKRSIVFLWDSGEERGLWGTRYFAHQPPVPLAQIVAEINIDMIGANRAPGSPDAKELRATGPNEVFVIGPRALSARATALLDAVNRGYLNMQFNSEHDRFESEFFYPRTDAGPFLERRILTIGFTTGLHARYHLPSDEARFLDPGKMEVIARTILVCAWALADAKERPGIDKPLPEHVPDYRAR